jgi:hypothetical protein
VSIEVTETRWRPGSWTLKQAMSGRMRQPYFV